MAPEAIRRAPRVPPVQPDPSYGAAWLRGWRAAVLREDDGAISLSLGLPTPPTGWNEAQVAELFGKISEPLISRAILAALIAEGVVEVRP